MKNRLNTREAQVLRYMVKYQKQHLVPPSAVQITRAIWGNEHNQNALQQLARLEAKGLVKVVQMTKGSERRMYVPAHGRFEYTKAIK